MEVETIKSYDYPCECACEIFYIVGISIICDVFQNLFKMRLLNNSRMSPNNVKSSLYLIFSQRKQLEYVLRVMINQVRVHVMNVIHCWDDHYLKFY